ncbi:MAG: hypothetical protein WCS43_18235, partial [Verrucomicrobiota bacterium]
YRPPQCEATPANPPEWVDRLAPVGKALRYRVVAVSADDDDSGASTFASAILPAPRGRENRGQGRN